MAWGGYIVQQIRESSILDVIWIIPVISTVQSSKHPTPTLWGCSSEYLGGSLIWAISQELLTKGTTAARCWETSQELMVQEVENTKPDLPYLGISRKSEQGLPETHEKTNQCEPETTPQFTSNCFYSQLNKVRFAFFLSFLFTMFWDRS